VQQRDGIQNTHTNRVSNVEHFEVYPNPVFARNDGKIRLSGMLGVGNISNVRIIDGNGRLVKSENGMRLPGNISVDMLIPGIYFVKIETVEKSFVRKIVVK